MLVIAHKLLLKKETETFNTPYDPRLYRGDRTLYINLIISIVILDLLF